MKNPNALFLLVFLHFTCMAAPQVPTKAETGVAGGDTSHGIGLAAPRGTPAACVETLSLAVAAVLQDTTLSIRWRDADITPCGSTPAAFADFIDAATLEPRGSALGAGLNTGQRQ